MDKSEIIERLKNIAGHAVNTVGEEPFVMSLDDGIAVHEAIELLEKPIQPNHNAEVSKMVDDCISRQAAMNAIAKMMPRSYTPDGSHPADEEIFIAQEIFADCIETIEILPSAQPTITHEQAIDYLQETGWLQNHDRILTESKIVPPVQPKNGTLIIPLNESDFKSVKRIILDNKPWCRTFYEDAPGEAHWIKSDTPDGGEIYECDNCGVAWQFTDGGPEENEAFFCPKCGFKMERDEQESE